MVAKACVCSQVLTTTASKDLGSSNTLRKSVNFFAAGYFAPAASSAFALTSHRATMFSEATLFRLEAPRPPVPMTAMLSLLVSRARRKAGATTAAPAAARKRRRVTRRLMAVLSRRGEHESSTFRAAAKRKRDEESFPVPRSLEHQPHEAGGRTRRHLLRQLVVGQSE